MRRFQAGMFLALAVIFVGIGAAATPGTVRRCASSRWARGGWRAQTGARALTAEARFSS